jgi:TatD DNase family protein
VIDTHAHLDMCFQHTTEVLVERATGVGITAIVTVSTDILDGYHALSYAEEHDEVFVAAGISPFSAATDEAARVDELRGILEHSKAVAVGETGLDTVRDYATLDEQRGLFDAQLELADDLGLPVVVHSREAAAETAAALEPFRGTVILHCFSSPDLLPTALERGYYVSFAGNVTYPKAEALREAAAAVPGDRLLVETDSPYLSPQPVRGTENEPAHLVHTIEAVALARGEEAAKVAATTAANARVAFRLP